MTHESGRAKRATAGQNSGRWSLFAVHPWYQAKLQRYARGAVRRRRLPAAWLEDVKQEAMLLLGRRLQRRPDLGLGGDGLQDRFAPWLLKMIDRDCRHAARTLASGHAHSTATSGEETTPVPSPRADPTAEEVARDAFLDFHTALENLSGRHRSIVELFAKGLSVSQIADHLHLTPRQIRYAPQQALQRLKNKMS